MLTRGLSLLNSWGDFAHTQGFNYYLTVFKYIFPKGTSLSWALETTGKKCIHITGHWKSSTNSLTQASTQHVQNQQVLRTNTNSTLLLCHLSQCHLSQCHLSPCHLSQCDLILEMAPPPATPTKCVKHQLFSFLSSFW